MDACTRYKRKSLQELTEAFQQAQEGVELQERRSSDGSDDCLSVSSPGDEAAGPRTPRSCGYSAMTNAPACPKDALHLKHIEEEARLPAAVCFSVLAYDVLGLVVCAVWGAFVVRSYVIAFGEIAGKHSVVYVLSVLVYAIVVMAALSRFCFVCFPSAEELRIQEDCGPEGGQRPFLELDREDGCVAAC